ncbi:MAG: 3'-5' exonuclease [Planctomycetes bacterium]|jgi:DNA polymerase III epsilon subunit family exonuclease|nr:3'-5' exonuclease [Planctomycetota bacterium]MBT4029504.1 3'-5' exonuclease [Planctomycetota bacterium]MBT4560626.1 3'-5' exonuclease [Planctomycetota bacterium]MBT5101200.1 3'-5' exonuclease [Planctomycetota bacterium]MBT5119523.1 3'-5' exonuclease [Planctomycetota bacterium]
MSFPSEFVVFDTETTGMPPSARLVEIGAVKVRGRSITDRYEQLLFPECPIPASVVAIHGIKDSDVADEPSSKEAIPEFLRWVGKLPLFGHNVAFDASMLAVECQRSGIEPPSNPVYCSLAASRKLLKGRRSHSLENLVRDLNLPEGPFHRASADAIHTLGLIQYLQNEGGAGDRLSPFGRGREVFRYQHDAVKLPDNRQMLKDAADASTVVDIVYKFRNGAVADLRVSPRFFFRRKETLYMDAVCHRSLHMKSYRLDCIAATRLAAEAPPITLTRKLS